MKAAFRFSSPSLLFLLLALSATAPAQEKRPNVLFLVSDDLNNSLGCYGGPAITPNLDRLAARGVRFDRAYCQYPLCGPSRASLLSGMRPDKIGVVTNGPTVRAVRKDVVTLPQLFRQNGYFTARTGKLYHLGIPGGVGTPGPDDPLSWDHAHNPPGAEFKTPGEEHNPTPARAQGFRRVLGEGEGVEQADYQAADEAIRLLNEHKAGEKPFFLAVGFIRPHVPVIAPRKYFDLYAAEKIALPDVPADDRDDIPAAAFYDPLPNWNMSEADSRESIRAYFACISFMDAQAGRVLDELERLELADNTIVVFVSDHGYLLGEHGTWQKMTLFDPVARVPMIVAAPGVKPASTKALAELIDVYPTVSELAGLKPPADVDGVSLVPVLKDPSSKVKEAAYTQVNRRKGEIRGSTVRTDRWRYTEWTSADGALAGAELYDEENDPRELKNLADDPAGTERVSRMKKMLRDVLPTNPPATSAARRR